MIIWLYGISGSGKTTLAKELKKFFNKQNRKSFILDGDLVRDFFDRDLGYSKKDRIENIKRIMLAAQVLSNNDMIVIVANIFPFEFLREFARKKFKNYIEIYLKRDIKNIKNKNNVYRNSKNVVGIDIKFEEPKNPTIVIQTDKLSINDSIQRILKVIHDRNQ